MIRHRHQSQVMAMAALVMVSLLAIVAFVLDASTFFVIRRELQNAADAGALAGAMYFSTNVAPPGPVDPPCNTFPDSGTLPRGDTVAHVACQYSTRNLAVATRLCNSAAAFDFAQSKSETIRGFAHQAVEVDVRCDAQFTFGRIINLSVQPIHAHAEGVLGTWDTSNSTFGQWTAGPGPSQHDATRLIPD